MLQLKSETFSVHRSKFLASPALPWMFQYQLDAMSITNMYGRNCTPTNPNIAIKYPRQAHTLCAIPTFIPVCQWALQSRRSALISVPLALCVSSER